jgi:hypothetical protein
MVFSKGLTVFTSPTLGPTPSASHAHTLLRWPIFDQSTFDGGEALLGGEEGLQEERVLVVDVVDATEVSDPEEVLRFRLGVQALAEGAARTTFFCSASSLSKDAWESLVLALLRWQ